MKITHITEPFSDTDDSPCIHGLTIEWENSKTINLHDDLQVRGDFWNIIEVILQDAHKEGSIVALKSAEAKAMEVIAAMKRNQQSRIIT